MDFAAVSRQEAHALAAVVRAAAAQRDEAVALFLLIHGKGFIHVVVRGIGHGLVVDGVGQLCGIKNIRYPLQNSRLDDALIGNDERFLSADALQPRRNITGAAFAHKRDIGDKK